MKFIVKTIRKFLPQSYLFWPVCSLSILYFRKREKKRLYTWKAKGFSFSFFFCRCQASEYREWCRKCEWNKWKSISFHSTVCKLPLIKNILLLTCSFAAATAPFLSRWLFTDIKMCKLNLPTREKEIITTLPVLKDKVGRKSWIFLLYLISCYFKPDA